jgi:predicted Rossmann-fold nucleotide-binding protein
VLFHRAYWNRIINFDAFVEEGMVSPADLQLFDFADPAEETWAALTAHGLWMHGATVE